MALVCAGALGYLYLTRGRPREVVAGPARPGRPVLSQLRRFGTRAERASMHR